MKRAFTFFLILFAVVCKGQLVTTSPLFIQENSSPIEITMDATFGNLGLKDYSPTSDVYVHIGVITNLSTSQSDWKYSKFTWGTTDPLAQAAYITTNKWKYTITGGLRNYFNITNSSEVIKYVVLLFRSGNGSKVQRNRDGSDLYIPVYDAGLNVRITNPTKQPTYTPIAEPTNYIPGNTVSLSAVASSSSTLRLLFNGTEVASAPNSTSINTNVVITTTGNQTIIAEATSGATSKRDTLQFFVTPGTVVEPLPAGVKDGINYEQGDTSAILVLYAPGKTNVSVIGDFNNWSPASHAMKKTPDGTRFWVRITALTPTTEYAYQYLVDGSLKIADPYTEKVLDPSNDQYISAATYPGLKAYPAGQSGIVSVLQTRQQTYAWTVNNFTHPEKKKLIIYELLLRDFLAAHDWKTLRDTLSYLKRLGINAIEVMPFNEFEGNISWGYNGYQYFAPDKYYGPKNSIKEFIDSCHKNGIAVIMDIVLNHTYGPSPLARLYWDAANNRPAADNPWYNASAPHSSIKFGEDFNHESAATKSFFNRVLQHWLTEYKIDGYRVDFSKGLTQKPSSTDGAFAVYDASRISILNGYYNTIKAVDTAAYFILEHFADNSEEKQLSDSGMMLWGNVWTQFQEASMGYLPNSNFQNGIHTARGWTNPHLVTFMESHDEERITYKNIKYGNASGSYNIKDTTTALKRMELNAAFLLTIPGPKMIWEFGELGYDYSRCYQSTNGEGGDCDKKTDPKPIRWDYQNNPNRKAVFDLYAKLIRLRNVPNFSSTFTSSDITYNLASGFKWIKVNSDSLKLLVVGNFDVVPTTGSVAFPNSGNWYNYITGGTRTATGAAENITLQPGEYQIFTSRDANNLIATPVRNVTNAVLDMRITIYPNPANNQSIIQYDLPESGNLTIDVLNITGQALTTLYSGFKAKGVQRVSLAGTAFTTAKLAPGTYLLKMTVNGKSKVQQFIVSP
jgi:1,4-alpha-glucan branching enzyme